MDDIAIKVENVSKSFILPQEKHTSLKSAFIHFYRRRKYEKQQALKNVSFEIKKGEFFGVVGRNGSGKSTLLKLLAGIYTPTEGTITVNGTLVPFIELGVGFNMELTGRENVYLNGSLLGFSRREMKSMYKDIVKFAELGRFMDQKLKNYSSGMQVRLAFSIAIRAQSDILLLDEVLAVGDAAFQRKCYRYFEEIKNTGHTVVLVSHNMDMVERFCDSALLLDSGTKIKMGSAGDVADVYREINLEENSEGAPSISERASLIVKVLKQTPNQVTFKMQHQEKQDVDYYFGFSIIKEGITFAELNGLNSPEAKINNKSITYELDTEPLNPGVYEISATLFRTDNKEPVAYTIERPQFIVKGSNANRGGALRLKDSWKS